MSSSQYYKLSGKFSPIGLAVTLGMGVVGALVSAAIYGYAMAWIPLVYFNVLLVIGYGVGLISFVSMAVRAGKIRNTVLGTVCGVFIGFVALYASWAFWIFAESSQEVFIWDPATLWEAILYLGDRGVWSIKGATPKGAVLFGFWTVEAVAIAGGATFGGLSAVTENAFCEDCGCWMEDGLVVGTFKQTDDVSKIRNGLEAGRLDELKSLYAVPDSVPHHTAALLENCAKCSNQLLSLKERIVTYDDNGNPKVVDTTLLERLIVNDQLVQDLGTYWEESLEEEEKKLKEQLGGS